MCPVSRCRRGLRRDPSGSALPTLPQSVSRGTRFRGFTGSRLLRPVRLLAPLDGSDQVSPATGDFYIQASGGSVTLPVAGYDYNSTGLLCWRDFHPQEWQLASLHRDPLAPCSSSGFGQRPVRAWVLSSPVPGASNVLRSCSTSASAGVV